MTDFTSEDFDDELMLLAGIIADIEADKGRVRIEHDNLKYEYLMGNYRAMGYTKRQTEDKLNRMTGEILGFESALRTVYIAQTAREQRRKGSGDPR